MSDNREKTRFSKLNDVLGFWGGTAPAQESQSKKIIIKGRSPQDIETKSIELQQKEALRKKFENITDHGFQKAMQYEAQRLPAYLDYEGMEYYPIIASALDIFMEESTFIGETGKMLNIYSDKKRIKEHLEDFFYNVIDVNTNLRYWTRQLTKYGDNFVYLLGEKKKGITAVKQLVNYETERIERIKDGKLSVVFKQRESSDEFNLFEVAHFRLLTDHKYAPYGTSVLSKTRRIFRQLVLAEDAMLTYRLLRAGEKKVFKIDVGNMDEDDVEAYIHKVATKFKRTQQIYPNDGQIDYRFNPLGNDEDYFLPVRNANSQTGIDTLQGATNLNDINDIEYLRDNLFTALGIPKPFLSFQQNAGDGKNLAQMDIRFTKKINRIQQALIQELNKIAIIHLYLLGFDKNDAFNFTLTLNNPSTQEELLRTELLQQKASLYNELTSPQEGGIAPMSHTLAKKKIFSMSDNEIIDDLLRQRIERVVQQELQNTPTVIGASGIFKDVDKLYGGNVALEGGDDGMGSPDDNLPPEGEAEGAVTDTAELPPVQGESYKPTDINIDRIKEYGKMLINVNNKKSDENEGEKKLLDEVRSNNIKINDMKKDIDNILKENDNKLSKKDIKLSMYRVSKDDTKVDNIDIMDIDLDNINENKEENNNK